MASRRWDAMPFLRSVRETQIPLTPHTAGTSVLLHMIALPSSCTLSLGTFFRFTTSLLNFQPPQRSCLQGFDFSSLVLASEIGDSSECPLETENCNRVSRGFESFDSWGTIGNADEMRSAITQPTIFLDAEMNR